MIILPKNCFASPSRVPKPIYKVFRTEKITLWKVLLKKFKFGNIFMLLPLEICLVLYDGFAVPVPVRNRVCLLIRWLVFELNVVLFFFCYFSWLSYFPVQIWIWYSRAKIWNLVNTHICDFLFSVCLLGWSESTYMCWGQLSFFPKCEAIKIMFSPWSLR